MAMVRGNNNHWASLASSNLLLPFLPFFLLFALFADAFPPDQGQFLLITDFHLDQKYDPQGDPTKMCHRENETPKRMTKRLGAFGDHDCDSPPALVEFMLDEAKRHLPNPDFVIWTGDTGAHVKYTKSEFLQTLKDGTESLRSRFAQNTLIIPVLGNHDFLPSNNETDSPTEFWLFEEIFNMWKDWIGEEAKETFTHGGYYRLKSPVDGADYLVLNTNIYYKWNAAVRDGRLMHPEDPLGQFTFLEQQLADVKRNNGAINVVAHIPPGAYEWDNYGTGWDTEMPRVYNQRLVRTFVEYAPWIRWMLFGHLHTDTFRILKDQNGKPAHVIFLSPSVTPMFQLNNPAFRIFEYNKTTMDLIDIKTFYVDLDELNKEGMDKVHAELEYSMRDAYSLNTLNAEAMNGVLERMAQDEQLFRDYSLRNRVQYITPNSSEPDRAVHLCVMANLDLDRLRECLDPHQLNAAPRRHPTTIGTSLWLLLSPIVAAIIVGQLAFQTSFAIAAAQHFHHPFQN